MNVMHRPPNENDIAFIMSTWLKGQRKQGDRAFMTNDVYFDGEKKRLTDILTKVSVIVICNVDDENHIYGWVAFSIVKDLFVIHYAHVKKTYRRVGIMTQTLSSIFPRFSHDETAITHINSHVDQVRKKYRLRFDPYIWEYL